MIATIINAAAVVVGAVVGVLLTSRITESYKDIVYTGIGIVSLVIGISMALEGQRVLYLALSLVLGGMLGNLLGIENGILRLGDLLRRRFVSSEESGDFAGGFLVASVLFCVGAMAIVGSFKAGAEGDYELILTKSVMDGFMAVLLAAVMGIGVGFSAFPILLYQGGLTLVAAWLRPLVTPLVLSEITGIGGVLVIMIGLNLLHLKEIKTANYVPALVIVLVFVALDPWIAGFLGG